MAKLRLTARARTDILEIAGYVAQETGNVASGRRLYRQISARCRQLASLPATIGRPRPELRSDLRSVAFKGYVIFFRYVGETLEIVNVLEGHRDIDSFYSDG